MLRRNPRGDRPEVAAGAFVDPTAILCGRVIVAEDAFIGPYAVVRADETDGEGRLEPIRIGPGANLQDGVVVHSLSGAAVTVGARATVAHRAIVHGPCVIGDGVFVGFNSVLFDCTVGAETVIRHNVVIEGCRVPDRVHVPSAALVRSETDLAGLPRVTGADRAFAEEVAATNVGFARAYGMFAAEF